MVFVLFDQSMCRALNKTYHKTIYFICNLYNSIDFTVSFCASHRKILKKLPDDGGSKTTILSARFRQAPLLWWTPPAIFKGGFHDQLRWRASPMSMLRCSLISVPSLTIWSMFVDLVANGPGLCYLATADLSVLNLISIE